MATPGTLLYTFFFGQKIGEDKYKNKYYEGRRKDVFGRPQRWVVFHGKAEASKIPPQWHIWLHHTDDAPIAGRGYDWQEEHLPNVTGTNNAYFPPGHIKSGAKRKKATGDYHAWTPTQARPE